MTISLKAPGLAHDVQLQQAGFHSSHMWPSKSQAEVQMSGKAAAASAFNAISGVLECAFQGGLLR